MKLLYFGKLTEAVGGSEQHLNLGEISNDKPTVKDLDDYLKGRYNQLNNQEYRITVNQKFVDFDYAIKEEDEVALLPPFSGG